MHYVDLKDITLIHNALCYVDTLDNFIDKQDTFLFTIWNNGTFLFIIFVLISKTIYDPQRPTQFCS